MPCYIGYTLFFVVRLGTSLFQHNLEVVKVHTPPGGVHPHHVVLKRPVLKDLVAGGALKVGRFHVFLAHVAFQAALLGRALSA